MVVETRMRLVVVKSVNAEEMEEAETIFLMEAAMGEAVAVHAAAERVSLRMGRSVATPVGFGPH